MASARERRKVVTWDDPRVAARQIRRLSGAEFFEQMRRGEIPEPPFGKLLGINMFDSSEGSVAMTLEPSEAHYNPMGCVHGGILSTLLDSVMSAAVHTALPAGRGYLTTEINVKFLRPVLQASGEIMAEGKLVFLDGKTATAEGQIIDQKGRICATGTATCVVYEAPTAASKDESIH
jgi:uncharacterized protein (TIGR00369 family)